MAPAYRLVTAAAARAVIGTRIAGPRGEARLGAITLAPHQQHAAGRLLALLRTHGGALLADDVGLGKTFIALAVARAYPRVTVLVPASLRPMWLQALERTGGVANLVTYEALSRGEPPAADSDLVILDEAHHARSTTARRRARIAAVTAQAHTLLLTATPVINRPEELRALLALFLGDRARQLDESGLGALIVRRTGGTVPAAPLPPVAAPRWVELADDASTLAALQQLPPPLAASDAGDGGALLLYGFARQWASSRAALRAALTRQLARATALEATLAADRLPTRAELAAWHLEGDALQLAFPELVAPHSLGDGARCVMLASDVRRHRDALVQLIGTLRRPPDPDDARARRLLDVRHRHRGEKVLAFSEYAATVQGYWRRLRQQAGIARLTARGGEIATGRVGRAEILRRFAPLGQHWPAPRAADAVTLLLTTDLLSEGVDLRDATVVVHLDLPWSPARMEQRVGRARRLGSPAERIFVYAFRPPAPAEALLSVEARLRRKIDHARRAVGLALPVIPPLMPPIGGIASLGGDGVDERGGNAGTGREHSRVERLSAVFDRVIAWAAGSAGPFHPDGSAPHPLVAAVSASMTGWIALATVAGEHRLVARLAGECSDEPLLLADAIDLAEGEDVETAAATIVKTLGEATRWASDRAAESWVRAGPEAVGGVGRQLAERIRAAYVRLPAARRAGLAREFAAARSVAARRLSAGLEQAIAALPPDLENDAWVRAVASLALPPSSGGGAPDGDHPRIEVAIVFVARG